MVFDGTLTRLHSSFMGCAYVNREVPITVDLA